jgi:hypothetical protein
MEIRIASEFPRDKSCLSNQKAPLSFLERREQKM